MVGICVPDLIVVGAGLFGLTIAERAAFHGYQVAVIEKRSHIGGNAYSYFDDETGIEIHKYGPHSFHTPNREVFEYLSRFTEWTPHELRVWSTARGNVYPMPINLATMCLFNGRAMSPSEARTWVALCTPEITTEPRNLEEKAISLVGRPLYQTFIRGYTWKQWQTDPKELPPEVISRLPVRYTFDNRYFNDEFQCMPHDGYTRMLDKMVSSQHIRVYTHWDWFDVRQHMPTHRPIVYTGPIDRYFDYRLGRLGWRTIDLTLETHDGDFQGCAQMNYADIDVPWTRIIEFKHFAPHRKPLTDKTIIGREFSRFATDKDEPYYPINLAADKALYARYCDLADAEPDVLFGGRLGTYRYLDMHQAVGAALKAWKLKVQPRLAKGQPFA
jgi:UDP-galactopyranose mutase